MAEAQGTEWGIGALQAWLFQHHNLTPLIPLSSQPDGTSHAGKYIGEGEGYKRGAFAPLKLPIKISEAPPLFDSPFVSPKEIGGVGNTCGIRRR